MDEKRGAGELPRFKAIRRRTLSGEAVEQILSLIRGNQLQPGDRLPPERELCRAFNIGRSSVREAIKILETTGLVRATNGGKEISIPRTAKIPEFDFAAGRTNFPEVFEARKAIEIELSALAARRGTSEEIANMRQALISKDATRSALAAGDIAFHRAPVGSAHNSVLSEAYNAITGLLFQHFKYHPLSWSNNKETRKASIRRVNKHHLEIIEAIEARDAAGAKLAMQSHLDRAEAELLASLGEQYLTVNDVVARDANHASPVGTQAERHNQKASEGPTTLHPVFNAAGPLPT